MSKKLSEKIDKYYDDAIGLYAEDVVQEAKKKKELAKKYGKMTNEDVLLDDVYKEIMEECEDTSHVMYGTPKAKKKKAITESNISGFPNDEDKKFSMPSDDDSSSDDFSSEDEDPQEDELNEDGEEKDEMDKVDEILETIDLAAMDNATKIELIRSIIDSAQNQSIDEEDEDEDGEVTEDGEEGSSMTFDEFMSSVKDVIEEFNHEETPEDAGIEDEGDDYSDEEMSDDEGSEDDEEMSDDEGSDEEFDFGDDEGSDGESGDESSEDDESYEDEGSDDEESSEEEPEEPEEEPKKKKYNFEK